MRTTHSLTENDRTEASPIGRIYAFRVTLTERHKHYLTRWLRAGQRMGLHDVAICDVDFHGRPSARHAVIWVRENPDPAYAVVPKFMHWQVRDCLRDSVLAEFANFEAALAFIRPVLEARLPEA